MSAGETPERPNDRDGPPPSAGTVPEPRRPAAPRVLYWTVPALTLLIGLALGAAIAGVSSTPEPESIPSPTASAPGAATPRPAVTVPPNRALIAPGECLIALDRGEQAMEAIRRGLRALGNLDGPELERVIDELQRIQPEFRSLAELCRSEAEITTPSPTST